MVRSGFTFIELMIVIVIIGTMSVVGINTFDSTRARIIFFNDVSKIEESLKLARSMSASDKAVGQIISGGEDGEETQFQNIESGVVAFFEYSRNDAEDSVGKFEKLSVYTTDDINNVEFNYEDNELIAEVDFSENQHLEIAEVKVFSIGDSGNFVESNSIKNNFYLTFSNEGKCDFLYENESGAITTATEVLFKIPIVLTSRNEAIRYLYMHKVACMPEILVTDFLTLENDDE